MPYSAHSDPLYRISDHVADGILVAEIRHIHPIESSRRAAVVPLYRDRGGESGDQLFRVETMRRDARLVPHAEQDGDHRRDRNHQLYGTKILYFHKKVTCALAYVIFFS